MTSPASAPFSPDRSRGFSLTEILVVIGIIAVIAGITLPMVLRAYRSSDKARFQADLQSITLALDAYRQDFGGYPAIDKSVELNVNGAEILCRALVGHMPALDTVDPTPPTNYGYSRDGADGYGFRTRGAILTVDDAGQVAGQVRVNTTKNLASDSSPQGRVFGPYISMDKFKIGDPNNPAGTDLRRFCILDRNEKPILYYTRNKAGTTPEANYVRDNNATAIYDRTQNSTVQSGISLVQMQTMLGDYSHNNVIDQTYGPETAATIGDYIVWCAGPDATFGPDSTLFVSGTVNSAALWAKNKEAVSKSDDILEFGKR